jgi:hypothetical protein
MRLSLVVVALALGGCNCQQMTPLMTPLTCDAGFPCGGACVTSDDKHCGACGTVCDATQACAANKCYPKDCVGAPCGANQVCPSGVCVDVSCAGVVCPSGQACAAGVCEPTSCSNVACPVNQVCYAGACTDSSCIGVVCPIGEQCFGGLCAATSCFDHMRDGAETDVDCGGDCPGCGPGGACTVAADCASRSCVGGHCATPTGCNDGKQNGSETDIDCGGPSCPACGDGQHCSFGRDCKSMLCGPGVCLSGPTCMDMIQNQGETDVDCGGMTSCPRCATGKHCGTGTDCLGAECSSDAGTGVCLQTPCSNGMLDPGETDVDCGGPTCGKCALGKVCGGKSDCQSNVCQMGRCVAAACNDSTVDGAETDIDCGGGTCPGCAAGKSCLLGRDCDSMVCDATKHCAAPTCTDNVQNGSESGVDCGGTCFPCGFTQPTYLPTGNNPRDVVAGDFDGDGNLDLAVNSENDATLAVFLGNGDGTFKPRKNYSTAIGQVHMVMGHIDGDALWDVVLTNPAAPGIGLYVMLGQDGGTFGGPIPYAAAVGYNGFPAALGDLNGDNKTDVVVEGFVQTSMGQKQGVNVLLGQGNGTFDAPLNTALPCCADSSAALGEVNGDGMLDIIASGSSGLLDVLPGLGGGMFGAAVPLETTAAGTSVQFVAVADLNGDGKGEVLAAYQYEGLRLYPNKGNGTFNPKIVYATQPSMTAGVPAGIVVGHIDRDANLDVAVSVSSSSTGVALFTGTGTGLLSGPTWFPMNASGGLALGDFDKDGKPDLAVVSTGNTVGVMLNRF